MGEYEIITSLAKDFMDKGDSPYWATRNALVEYRIALKDALEYEYKRKRKQYKNRKKTNSSMRGKLKRGKLIANKYKGTWSEVNLCRDICHALNEYGFLYGNELLEYIVACDNIGKILVDAGGIQPKPIDLKKMFDFIELEELRLTSEDNKLC